MKLEKYKNDLELGDYGEDLLSCGYTSYISDAIDEFADNNVSIYYSEISQFMAAETAWVERAINEFGWDGCDRDLYKAAQTGEYLKIQDEIYPHIDDILRAFACDVLEQKGLQEIDEKIVEFLDGIDNDSYNKFSEISDDIENLLSDGEDGEE